MWPSIDAGSSEGWHASRGMLSGHGTRQVILDGYGVKNCYQHDPNRHSGIVSRVPHITTSLNKASEDQSVKGIHESIWSAGWRGNYQS